MPTSERNSAIACIAHPTNQHTDGLGAQWRRVIVTKNPCLHPGDIRVLRAVDPPGGTLSHLVNVVVFPQRGLDRLCA
jgi:hypothetical protein